MKRFFGGRTKAEKQAEREAREAQRRQQRDAEEEAQRNRAERAASGRLLRGGRRLLTFEGASSAGAATLGG